MICYECKLPLEFEKEVIFKGVTIHKFECPNCGKDFIMYLTPPLKMIQMPQYSA